MLNYQVWFVLPGGLCILLDSDNGLAISVIQTLLASFICEDRFHYMMQVLWVFFSAFLPSVG